jgi:hypothetical protein
LHGSSLRFTPDLRQVTLIIRSVSVPYSRQFCRAGRGPRTYQEQAAPRPLESNYSLSVFPLIDIVRFCLRNYRSGTVISDRYEIKSQGRIRCNNDYWMTGSTEKHTPSRQNPTSCLDDPAELNVVARSLPLLGIQAECGRTICKNQDRPIPRPSWRC